MFKIFDSSKLIVILPFMMKMCVCAYVCAVLRYRSFSIIECDHCPQSLSMASHKLLNFIKSLCHAYKILQGLDLHCYFDLISRLMAPIIPLLILSLSSGFLTVLQSLCSLFPPLFLAFFDQDSHRAYSLTSFKSPFQCHHFL